MGFRSLQRAQAQNKTMTIQENNLILSDKGRFKYGL